MKFYVRRSIVIAATGLLFLADQTSQVYAGTLITPLKMSSGHMAEIVVSGTVTDTQGPLIGVTVMVKGTTTGAVTDVNGKYSIRVPDANAVLVFSYTGYQTIEKDVKGQTSINILMQSGQKSLDEVVVIGYGTQKRVNLTGSVSSVTAKDIEARPFTQASQALAGVASGVTVTQSTGRPGGDGTSIRIRGIGTFSGAGNNPLVLIDGLSASLNDIDPNNIETISVLKDAASASIYGTRAANGVILIETKKGKKGATQISYNNYFGWQRPTELPNFVSSAVYAEMKNIASPNTYTQAEIQKFRDGSDPDNYPDVPHLKNLLNSNNGFQTSHNVEFSGGSEKTAYLFSTTYLHQNGIVAKNDFDRYNILFNVNSQLKDNLVLRVNMNGYTFNVDEPRHYEGDMSNMIRFAVREGPVYAGLKSDGTYGYQDNYSPEAWLSSNSFVNRKNRSLQSGAELAWEPLKGFTLSGKAGYKYFSYTDKNYVSDFRFNNSKYIGPNFLQINSGDNYLVTLQALAQYTKKFGNQNLNILAGFSQEEYHENGLGAYRNNFPNNSLYELNAGSSTNMQNSGSASEWGLRSFFGRINYSIKDRYLFEVNGRYDGTSRFPSDGRWAFFPSVSAGWRISEEEFFKKSFTWVDNLKIRASWGQLGNQNIGNYPYQNVLALGQNYPFGGVLASGARVNTLANANIKWETTTATDLGLDVSIFKNRLNLVFDYFNKTTSDILSSLTVSSVLGLTPSEVNAGKVKNSGFEFFLNYQQPIGKVVLGVSPNFTYTRNRVTELAGGISQDINRGLFVGQPINAIYGYVADGLFLDANDIKNYPSQPYSAEPGFVRYKDISGPNGVPDGVVDATYDRKIIGSSFPKFSYGLTLSANYKGFDASVFFQGLGGFQKLMGPYQAYAFFNGGQIQQWQVDNRWDATNPDRNAKYVKITNLSSGSGTTMPSTYWMRDASFVRVKNLQVGYTFPGAWMQRIKMSRLRVFASGQNLFTINKFYQGWDPEMDNGDYSAYYPITRVITFGLSARF